MDVREFESHLIGAVNSALKSNVPPAQIVISLEGAKLEIMLRIRDQNARAALEKKIEQQPQRRIVTLDGANGDGVALP